MVFSSQFALMLRMPLCMQAEEPSEAPSPSTPDRKADAKDAEPALEVTPTEAFQRYQKSAAEAAAHPPGENGQAPAAEVRCGPKHLSCQRIAPDAPTSEACSGPKHFSSGCSASDASSYLLGGGEHICMPVRQGEKSQSMINLAEPAMVPFKACRAQRKGRKGDSGSASGDSHRSRKRMARQPKSQGTPQTQQAEANGMQAHAKYWFTHASVLTGSHWLAGHTEGAQEGQWHRSRRQPQKP